MIDLEKLRELAKCQTGKKLCVQAEELASILDRLVALERDAGRMDWIEKNGDVRIQRVRAGFNGPLRWDVEYGPYAAITYGQAEFLSHARVCLSELQKAEDAVETKLRQLLGEQHG